MKLADLMEQYRPGSENPPWNWEDERKDLFSITARPEEVMKMAKLIVSVHQRGVINSILLGNDGRIWDGHHRIIAAWVLNLEDVPTTTNVTEAIEASV